MKAFMVMPDIEDLNNSLLRNALKEKSLNELRKFVDLYGPKMNEDELNSILEKATEDITNRFEEVTSNGHIAEISSLNKIKIIGDGKGNLELIKKKFILKIRKENILDLVAQSSSFALLNLSIAEHFTFVNILTIVGILAVIKSTHDADELKKMEITPVHLDVIKVFADLGKRKQISKSIILEKVIKLNENNLKSDEEKEAFSSQTIKVLSDLTKAGVLRSEGNDSFSLTDKVQITI